MPSRLRFHTLPNYNRRDLRYELRLSRFERDHWRGAAKYAGLGLVEWLRRTLDAEAKRQEEAHYAVYRERFAAIQTRIAARIGREPVVCYLADESDAAGLPVDNLDEVAVCGRVRFVAFYEGFWEALSFDRPLPPPDVNDGVEMALAEVKALEGAIVASASKQSQRRRGKGGASPRLLHGMPPDDVYANPPAGHDYESPIVVNPTWLDVAALADEAIRTVNDYHHVGLEGIATPEEYGEDGHEAVPEFMDPVAVPADAPGEGPVRNMRFLFGS